MSRRSREGRASRQAEQVPARAVSPVVGTVLMIALTLLLASVIVASLGSFSSKVKQPDESIEVITTETATANPWEGAIGDLVRLSNDQAGATGVRIQVNFTVNSGSDTIGNSLNSVKLDVQTGSPDMFTGTSQDDLRKAVVDTDADGAPEENIESDLNGWQVSNGGSTVKVEFSGSAYTAAAEDSIIIVFSNVDNPPAPGTYDVRVETSGDGNWQSGTITVE